ncbi:MAG: exonuclease, partial [Bacteroidia bacterium]|nr:exonuclease [Bacteroidia bacterium]
VTGSELVALLLESHEIKTHKPLFNHAKRRSAFNYGIETFDDLNGYKNLRLIKVTNESSPIASFATHDAAKDYLYELVNEYTLCQKLSGLYDSQAACFNYQLKQCNGACINKEPAETYNQRVLQAIESAGLNNRSFFMFDKGRTANENSIIQVHNGKYIGFGYIDKSESVTDIETLEGYITKYPDNRDAQQIIKSFYANKKIRKVKY